MINTTLCFLIKDKEILLGLKKRKIGKGKFNGFGGKVDKCETIKEATVRELFEECLVKTKTDDLKKVAEIAFVFPHPPKEEGWDQLMHVYFIYKWDGIPTETEEMTPKWFNIDKLPYEQMWEDDKYWLHKVLGGEKIKARFNFKQDSKSIKDYKIDIVNEF